MDPLQVILTGGAAGALFWVVKLLVDGKLHTDSEVAGLRADIADLKKINKAQGEALKAANAQQTDILKLLRTSQDSPGSTD